MKNLGSRVTESQLSRFKTEIWTYYEKNKREFPWRETQDPYAIVVSEIMLQQTQTARVVEKYENFLATFPTFKALATAPLGDVLRLWQGLGYNRRAIALKEIAEIVTGQYGGRLPNTLEELDALPGIGAGTAGSISAFAFNIAHPFIETNIRRVFIHFFFPRARTVHDDKLFPLIEAALDRENPREWYYALMDYGAMLGREVVNPNRRSRHYAKQSKFKGSNRELRGAVLRTVTVARQSKKRLSEKALIAELGASFDSVKVQATIEALIAEGFFKRMKGDIVA